MKKFLLAVAIAAAAVASQAQSICTGYGLITAGGGGSDGMQSSSMTFTIGAQVNPFLTDGKGMNGYGASTCVFYNASGIPIASVSMYSRSIDLGGSSCSFNGPAIIIVNGSVTFGTASVTAFDVLGADAYFVSTSNGVFGGGSLASGGVSIY